MKTILLTVGLLVLSNTFMTMAWYGHLKYRDKSLLLVIMVSWLIALPEYVLQVPANRYGSLVLSATQLKILQEAISLSVFIVFAWIYFHEQPTMRTLAAMVLAAVMLVRGGAPISAPVPVNPGETTTGTGRSGSN